MAAGNSISNAILEAWLRGTTPTLPSRVYISLHTADPGATGASEVTLSAWPAYLRQDPAGGAAMNTGFNAAASKKITNAKAMLFPGNDGAAAVTITHACVWDATTTGNMLISGALTASKSFAVGDEPVIKAGSIEFNVT